MILKLTTIHLSLSILEHSCWERKGQRLHYNSIRNNGDCNNQNDGKIDRKTSLRQSFQNQTNKLVGQSDEAGVVLSIFLFSNLYIIFYLITACILF